MMAETFVDVRMMSVGMNRQAMQSKVQHTRRFTRPDQYSEYFIAGSTCATLHGWCISTTGMTTFW